eukprot:6518956-Prymnesium_polylepis.1
MKISRGAFLGRIPPACAACGGAPLRGASGRAPRAARRAARAPSLPSPTPKNRPILWTLIGQKARPNMA